MRKVALSVVALATTLLLGALPATAQRPTSGSDRLFLSFVQDATLAETQWWEGQLEYADGVADDLFDAIALNGIFAVQFRDRIELGGRVGFGETDGNVPNLPDGSGATDLQVWGKYHLGSQGGRHEYAGGALFTVPTGDDGSGLGADAFAVEFFGAYRYRADWAVFTGNVGVELNGDGEAFGSPEVDGEVAPSIGAGIMIPLSDQVGFVGEARVKGERFDGADEDIRISAGLNWRIGNRGMIRPAVAFGLADGAPDATLLASYAHQF